VKKKDLIPYPEVKETTWVWAYTVCEECSFRGKTYVTQDILDLKSPPQACKSCGGDAYPTTAVPQEKK